MANSFHPSKSKNIISHSTKLIFISRFMNMAKAKDQQRRKTEFAKKNILWEKTIERMTQEDEREAQEERGNNVGPEIVDDDEISTNMEEDNLSDMYEDMIFDDDSEEDDDVFI